jgi:hypothetical protein
MGELRELALRVRASDHVDLETLISTLIERHKPEHVLEFVSYIITGSAQPTASSADSACTGMCGFVWKTGDTVYHCRTCGMDPSCAICHDCIDICKICLKTLNFFTNGSYTLYNQL